MSHDKSRHHLSLEDGLTLWRARDAYRVQKSVYGLLGLLLLLHFWGYSSSGRWGEGLVVVAVDGLFIWGIVRLCRLLCWGSTWLVHQTRRTLHAWWHGLVLVLVLGGLLSGCAGTYRQLALLYGCDPVAIDQGYCTMPKGGGKP